MTTKFNIGDKVKASTTEELFLIDTTLQVSKILETGIGSPTNRVRYLCMWIDQKTARLREGYFSAEELIKEQ